MLNLTLRQIGEQLTELRKQAGYSSYETFAYDHDLPRMQYWRMEKGKVNITIKSLLKILAIHKIGLAEFFSSMRYKKGK
ncbi:MAG: XRE family transcriptional regulator [Flammeovirgaceae bacterium]|nr:MAG: XRE family transcriptional regulator [Flammeovirgaceae bacterium]